MAFMLLYNHMEYYVNAMNVPLNPEFLSQNALHHSKPRPLWFRLIASIIFVVIQYNMNVVTNTSL